MALTLLASNNASSVLTAGISSSATTLTVNTGTGVLFPAPVSGTSYFKLTLVDAATGTLTEIVHVTAVSGDVFTIARAQEGTTARIWSANDIAANMFTAGTLGALLQVSNNLSEIATAGSTAQSAARNNLGVSGILLGAPKIITTNQTYTPSAGTKYCLVEVQGGGGGGGGSGSTPSTGVSVGAGGGSGGYAKGFYPVASLTGQTMTIGSGGAGGNLSPTAGSSGGQTSFGSLIVCGGGTGGIGTNSTPPFSCYPGSGGSATGGNILNLAGDAGTAANASTGNSYIAGRGGNCPLGSGGLGGTTTNAGKSGTGFGAGGSGSATGNNTTAPSPNVNGGAGAPGVIIIWEYA